MDCKKCNNKCLKNGFQVNGKQRFYYKMCKLSQQQSYTYKAYSKFIDYNIYNLLINSSGISDIGRVLKISINTVCSRILKLSKLIKSPKLTEVNQNYEVDELFASPTKKYWYVAYAINRSTNEVINFSVGRRTKENLDKVIHSVLKLSPKKNIYR